MDVVVVGGGIVGLSAAYYPADAGTNVTLFEQNSLGTGSTARSASGIRSQFSTRVNLEFSVGSRKVGIRSRRTSASTWRIGDPGTPARSRGGDGGTVRAER